MAVKYLAGDRLIGTAAERTALSGTTPDAVPQTSWKQLAKTTLSSAGDVLDSGTFTAKDNLMILIIGYKSSNGQIEDLTFNSDTGNNYARRYSETGGSDSTEVSQDSIQLGIDSEDDEFAVLNVRNIAGQEKLVIGHTVARQGGTGSGTAPTRLEVVGKWTNTSNAITRVTLTNPHSGDLDTGSELVVLGMDDDEADSGTNFWQELANPTDLASAGDTLNSGTFTAKDYLMVDVFRTRSGSVNSRIQVNGDTGSNYAHRNYGASSSYGSDALTDGGTSIHSHALTTNDSFTTYLIINKASKEKLMIIHEINRNTAGASNVPDRMEVVAKWANTSDAITSINVLNTDSGNLDVGTSIRVWGGTPT